MPELSSTGNIVLWLVLLVVFLVAEAVSVQLVSAWFALGAFGALIASLCNVGFVWQVCIFVAVSVVCLVVTRPLVKKFTKSKIQRTNVDRCIGTQAVVTEEINNLLEKGQVKVDGKVWTARSADNTQISVDSVVMVEKIEGVKLIVKSK